ncbi:hypothetical protein ACLB2K_011392 [Fragaria x ananassa]
MILLNDYDDFSDIMTVPLDFFWIWVEVYDLPRHSPHMPHFGWDYMMLNHGRVPCPNAQHAIEGTKALIGPVVALAAPPMVFRANSQAALVVSTMPTLLREKKPVQITDVAKVTGIIRNRKEDETESGKRLKHSLAMCHWT